MAITSSTGITEIDNYFANNSYLKTDHEKQYFDIFAGIPPMGDDYVTLITLQRAVQRGYNVELIPDDSYTIARISRLFPTNAA